MSARPIVLIHGYSDKGASLEAWRDALGRRRGAGTVEILLSQYVSLSNEITIKDIAEGLNRALVHKLPDDAEFDAIVHSTGMLVIREWLTAYEGRAGRLKHLIGLAPATFGSPLAHKGRSWLGGLFKGSKDLASPDFLESGDRVLAALELGSRYTWDLSHKDLFCDEPAYGPDANTPYPFVFIGLDDYGAVKRALTAAGHGTDGTVRRAAAGLDSRKFEVDLRRGVDVDRVLVRPTTPFRLPLTFIPDRNHGSILHHPSDELVEMVDAALDVDSSAAFDAWKERFAGRSAATYAATEGNPRWQQFVVRLVDERGDPIRDWYLEVGTLTGGKWRQLEDFDIDVHPYTTDHSLRCFHVDLNRLSADSAAALSIRLIASSGTAFLRYIGDGGAPDRTLEDEDAWDAQTALPAQIDGIDVLTPYTTTLIEITLNREPMPIGQEPNQVFQWYAPGG